MPGRGWIPPVIAALVLCACGGSAPASKSASSSPSSSASASATPASRSLIVVSERDPDSTTAATLRLLRPDGSQVQSLTVKAGAELLAAAGARIFVRSGSALKAIHQDGSVEELGDLGLSSASFARFAASPDGTRWMWGTFDQNGQGQVHLAGDGLSARVVAQSSENGRAIEPYTWTPAGAFLADEPVGIGGYILFDPASGPVKKLDPASFTTSAVSHTDGCAFSDMSRDGTIACFGSSGGQNARSLILFTPDGKQQTIQLATPRFNQEGDAYFSRDGATLTVAGVTNAGSQGQPEQFGTDLVTVKDGSIRRLSIDGVRLPSFLRWQSWLQDGSLVVWRPSGAGGGAAGVFVVSPSGQAKQISNGGFPIGLLTG